MNNKMTLFDSAQIEPIQVESFVHLKCAYLELIYRTLCKGLEKCLGLVQMSKKIVGSQIHLIAFKSLVQNTEGFLKLVDLKSKNLPKTPDLKTTDL